MNDWYCAAVFVKDTTATYFSFGAAGPILFFVNRFNDKHRI